MHIAIISHELSATSNYQQDSIHEISKGCGKIYVKLLLSTDKSEFQQCGHRLNHCSGIEQWEQC